MHIDTHIHTLRKKESCVPLPFPSLSVPCTNTHILTLSHTHTTYSLLFLRIWDVGTEAMANGDFDGMWKLTLACGCLQLVGICFVKLLPKSAAHQEELQLNDKTIYWGGVCMCVFVGVAFVATIVLDVCYMTLGGDLMGT